MSKLGTAEELYESGIEFTSQSEEDLTKREEEEKGSECVMIIDGDDRKITNSSSSMPSVMKGMSSSRVLWGPSASAMVVNRWIEVRRAETSSDFSSSIKTCGGERERSDRFPETDFWLRPKLLQRVDAFQRAQSDGRVLGRIGGC